MFVPKVSFAQCDTRRSNVTFCKKRFMMLASEYIGMPSEFDLVSTFTGKTIRFKVIGENDPMFDQDQWDGTQQIYRPTEPCKLDYFVIYNQY